MKINTDAIETLSIRIRSLSGTNIDTNLYINLEYSSQKCYLFKLV